MEVHWQGVSLSKYVCKVYHLKKTKDVYIQNTGNGCGRRARNDVLDRIRHSTYRGGFGYHLAVYHIAV